MNPQAPTHILVLPKELEGLNMLSSATPENIPTLGNLLYTASVIAKQENLDNGYRIVINCGKDGCNFIKYLMIINFNFNLGQSVNYLHIHLLGGAKFGWPPGTNY